MNVIPREKKIAQKIVKRHSLVPPIDLMQLLKKYADYVEDSLPHNVDAICIMNIERPLVVLDRFQVPNRKRFTLAHEIGHLTLPWHYGMISCHTDTEDQVDGSAYQKMEAEANSFAAELLMPSSWLEEIVATYENKGLDELLNIVSEKAEVSRTAAFFSIFDHLPNGYIAFVANTELHYGKIMRSNGTKVFIPKQNDFTDFEWLDNCAEDSGRYDWDKLKVFWWKINNNLSEDDLLTLTKSLESDGLESLFSKIAGYGIGTFASVFMQLINLLPPGYVFITLKGDYQRVFSSPETNVRIPYNLDNHSITEWLKEYSNTGGHFSFFGYDFFWAKFIVRTPVVRLTNDPRHSKDILKSLLNECYSDEDERTRYMRKINGIVGALNNVAPREFNEFYRLFKERFIGVEIFSEITKHPLFEAFVINKINELLKKGKK